MASLFRSTLRAGVPDKTAFSHNLVAPVSNALEVKSSSSHREYAAVTPWAFEDSGCAPRLPSGSWDSHMHIVGDAERYPLAPTAAYKPSMFNVSQAVTFETSLGISNVVIVQPSVYGPDNSCLLDALRALGSARARGVVAFSPGAISSSILQDWHDLGVRGVRLNVESTGDVVDHAKMGAELIKYSEAVRPLGWVVQLYVPLHMIPDLEPIIPTLGVRVCIDHMGAPRLKSCPTTNSPLDPYSLKGFASLIRLLAHGNTFVKLSAAYRFSGQDDYIQHVEPMARELLRAAPQKVVFATDWPHTRFEGLDIQPWVTRVMQWCMDDQELINGVFRDNARTLWA
ncbi:hypothetical protein BD289DRAFT_369300 [Coniella lustricola]|uniref:Amidohydrolase-related domain-containing protein n=1 Tax=Coniella lustricola TaxID=2025994 RepID=A0A2T3A6W0_9PEZI|nr:hypothetical protein BD289DRAFT_369300 [Coniella lustricola]